MPDRYFQMPVDVEVVQFRGWSQVEHINSWLSVHTPLFVPRGYEHGLRRANEKDRATQQTYDEAVPYLVLTINDEKRRIDENQWIVRYRDGRIEVYDTPEFNKLYDRSEESEQGKALTQ